MARYAVPFQAFITNGAVITSDVTGRVATAGNTTLTLSTTGGAGTFTITLGSGCTGTLTSGTATITGSVLALSAGANTVTSNGAGNCTLNLTLGTAANTNTVNTWSATSGGVSGSAVPGATDDTYFDANSFTAASQVATVDALSVKDSIWTGATNNPTFTNSGGNVVNYSGSLTLISAMTYSVNTRINFAGNGSFTFTSGGLTIPSYCELRGTTGILTLQDNLTVTDGFGIGATGGGQIITNNKTVTVLGAAGSFRDSGTVVAHRYTFGSSVINCVDFLQTGTNLTIDANTATLNISKDFNGASKTTYNILNLTGATSTVTGNNTFNTLGFTRAGVQTITATGTTQTVNNVTRSTGVDVKTLVNGSYVNASSSIIYLNYYSISGCTFTPANMWRATNSTDGGTNTGIPFITVAGNRVKYFIMQELGLV